MIPLQRTGGYFSRAKVDSTREVDSSGRRGRGKKKGGERRGETGSQVGPGDCFARLLWSCREVGQSVGRERKSVV